MKLRKALTLILLATVVFAGVFSACKKEVLVEGTALTFSADTVQFDTVFTTIGSTTKAFRVYNPSKSKIKIDEIRLAGGPTSQFRINIDGTPSYKLNNVELEAGDSIWVFVEVTVDPQNINTPFVIADSVVFTSGTTIQDVKLVAWGQDAYYTTPTISSDTGLQFYSILDCNNNTWTNEKPHVIFGSLVVPNGCTLTIEAGTDVRFYKNSCLVISPGGKLIVNGLPDQKVTFGGTRNEDYLKDTPGQWGTYYQVFGNNGEVFRIPVGGIWINSASTNNIINNAVIKNSYIGLQIDSAASLTLSNTEIYNNNSVGLLAQNGIIKGFNNVVSNAGNYSVALSIGGDYEFRHCTFTNYWAGGVRQTPTLLLNNYYNTNNGAVTANFSAYFGNSIIYGNVDNEVGFDFVGGSSIGFKFDKCLLKIDPDIDTSDPNLFTNIIKNPNPDLKFKSYYYNDFHLDTLTIAQNAGDVVITNAPPMISVDNEGKPRNINGPDLGAFERDN